jgi:hypothetical protein
MIRNTRKIQLRPGQLLLACALALAGCAGQIEADAAPESASVAETAEALACLKDLPPELAVPDGHRFDFRLKGVGVQIYSCNTITTPTGTSYGWVLKAPDADLLFPNGRIAGSHYAGPTWEALDGSTVVGMRLAGVTVDATAIPWLLLQATAHTGTGKMANVSYIQRLHTTGGLAPSPDTCGAGNIGALVNVDYTADYVFYRPLPAWPSHP